ncbi:MAG TPA: hypothetical protein VFF80_02310 [Bacillota bacterium]|nr:hypothetical protein [Bacillota bacterium]
MEAILLSPPILFVFFFFLLRFSSRWLSRYANKSPLDERALDAYACGQRNIENYVNPDYSQFFQYAFVFTVAHVMILVVATAPSSAQLLPIVYIITGMLTILIVFKR